MYRPVAEIVPTNEFPPTTPATSQFRALLVVPETVAVNCCDLPTCTLALLGDIVTETCAGAGRTVTAAFAELVGAKALCAVTATGPVGTLAGAVYNPLAEIVPTDELPPTTPPTSQFTPVFVVPDTLAVNCCDLPTCTLALPGDIVTVIGVGPGAGSIVTFALALLVPSVAVTTTDELALTSPGAV